MFLINLLDGVSEYDCPLEKAAYNSYCNRFAPEKWVQKTYNKEERTEIFNTIQNIINFECDTKVLEYILDQLQSPRNIYVSKYFYESELKFYSTAHVSNLILICFALNEIQAEKEAEELIKEIKSKLVFTDYMLAVEPLLSELLSNKKELLFFENSKILSILWDYINKLFLAVDDVKPGSFSDQCNQLWR